MGKQNRGAKQSQPSSGKRSRFDGLHDVVARGPDGRFIVQRCPQEGGEPAPPLSFSPTPGDGPSYSITSAGDGKHVRITPWKSNGPAKVNSDAYRAGWDAIFGPSDADHRAN